MTTRADVARVELSSDPVVYTVAAFADAAQCTHLIELARTRLERSKVSSDDKGVESAGRTGSNAWIPHDTDEATLGLCEQIADLVGIPLDHAEALQVVHYDATQEYQPHFDAYDLATTKGRRATANGGQRMTTALLYLSDEVSGGATTFPKLDIDVEPETGKLLVFENCRNGTDVHPSSLHGGAPVTAGQKWAVNLWFHERPRTRPASTPARAAAQPPLDRRSGAIVANRARAHLEHAARILWPNGHLPANLTYWDPWSGELETSELDPNLPTLRVLNRRADAQVDNKSRFARALVEHGIEHLAPATFFDRAAALDIAQPGQIWFVKPAASSAGHGMHCITSEQLAKLEVPQHAVIQSEVADPALDDEGRKFTMRAYVLAWAGRLFVFDEGRARSCPVRWTPGSTDLDQQIGHAGAGASEHLQPGSTMAVRTPFAQQAFTLATELRPVFRPIIDASSLVDYQLGALDYISTDDGRPQVLEYNGMPNLIQGEPMDTAVNRPLILEALRLMCAGGSTRWSEVVDAQI